jgi:diguanylate cyclase
MPLSRRELGETFARRIYGPRSIGCLLSATFIGTVLGVDPDTPMWVWGAMLTNLMVWPTLAYLLARRAADPFAVELRSLALDGLFAGGWAGLMALNLLPSVLLLSMVAMNAMAAGGWRLLRITVGLQGVGLLLALGLRGFELSLATSALQQLACLPMLIIYPLIVARASYDVSVQLAVHKKAFKLISKLDGMTRLLHHASWMEKLVEIFPRCRRGEVIAMVALIDIDNFKRINDEHGHLMGDAIIGRLANLLRSGLGASAAPGRYGGDEFCLLLFDMSLGEATQRLDDIRRQFSDWVDATVPIEVTLSIGLVPYSHQYASERDWIKATDEALYRAKRSGKNQLCVQYSEAGGSTAGA